MRGCVEVEEEGGKEEVGKGREKGRKGGRDGEESRRYILRFLDFFFMCTPRP